MDLKDLKPATYNPRIMSDKSRKGLRRSLKEFGDLSGITFNKQTGNLVTGHHRMSELMSIWGEKLKIHEDPQSGLFDIVCPNGDIFPLRVVDWNKTKEMAANITANNTAIQGKFTDKLQPLLWKIKENMNETFSELRLDSLVRHAKTRSVQAEEEFSEVLNECNQYVVLVFRNTVDWLSALTHFKLETKTAQRSHGKAWSKGIGRVIDGARYLKEVTSERMGEK